MKAIAVAITVLSSLAWDAAASAQYGYGVPGGYFGSGGLYSGGGSPSGVHNASPSYGSTPYGTGSTSLFRGFTYSPDNYSSPSYGLLSPSFGGPSSSLGFGTASSLGFTVPTYVVPAYVGPNNVAPIHTSSLDSVRLPYAVSEVPSDMRYSRLPYPATVRREGFLPAADGVSFYGTGFGCSLTWKNHVHVRPW